MFEEDNEYPTMIKTSTRELELLDKSWRKQYDKLNHEKNRLKLENERLKELLRERGYYI